MRLTPLKLALVRSTAMRSAFFSSMPAAAGPWLRLARMRISSSGVMTAPVAVLPVQGYSGGHLLAPNRACRLQHAGTAASQKPES